MAVSAFYAVFFAIISLLPNKLMKHHEAQADSYQHRFLVLFPAYAEDTVIQKSIEAFLQQTYPTSAFKLCVISDHMQPETNEWLRRQPLHLLQPAFEKSSKGKALQYAIEHSAGSYDYVVVLDADNIVAPDFLYRLNALCYAGHYQAIQCHRKAKNSNNDVAVLDSLSEEINNTLFRRAHNRIGLSSALIGSGMCFDFKWFSQNVCHLSSAVEDRELEALLMRQNIFIKYAEDIYVLDEKVSSDESFQRQRLRWMNGQIQSLIDMSSYLPTAIRKGNLNYIDKTIQQALLPRSVLLVVIPSIALLMLILKPLWSIKWWLLFVLLSLAIFIATPHSLRSFHVLSKIASLPRLVWRMLLNLLKLDRNNKDFIHTAHHS